MSNANSAIKNKPRAEVPKLKDDDQSNNYGAWAPKMRSLLKRLELWQYIEGPGSITPMIPAERPMTIVKGLNTTTNQVMEVRVDGNADEVKKVLDDSKPWREGDEETRGYLIDAMPESATGLFTCKKTAKEF